MTVLISLDLSAAFETIDHTILLSRLQTSSAYLDSPLHGSTPILWGAVNVSVLAVPRLQLLCAPRAFRKDMPLALFFPNSSHQLHILSVHMASRSRNMLTTLSSMSPYPKKITILQLQNSSFVSRPSIPGSAITGYQINPRQSCLALPSAHLLFQLSLLSMSPEPLSRFPIRSGFLALPLTVDSHMMHTSLHFQNPVSITSVHSATSVPTSH